MAECKPCKAAIEETPKVCRPFSVCVGNKSLVYDGSCLYLLDRKTKIKAGTYTSITFDENGCVVGAGQAPLAEYTPQACCGTADEDVMIEQLLDKISQNDKLKQKLKDILGV